jgi:hypothetical protein
MMTGLVRKATLLSVCGLLAFAAGVAVAGVPDAGHSVIGTGINLIGATAGVPDPHGLKQIVVKDAGGTPVQNSTVTINFAASTAADIRLCASQPFAGMGVSCANHELVALTDATGTASFTVLGGANNVGGGILGAPAPGFGLGGATVKADGVLLGTLDVGAADQNNNGGVNVTDLALFLNDRFSITGPANYRGRSDYNGSGTVDVTDLALFLQIRFGNQSSLSCAASCP